MSERTILCVIDFYQQCSKDILLRTYKYWVNFSTERNKQIQVGKNVQFLLFLEC